MPGVPSQDTAELPLAGDQHMVQALRHSVPANRPAQVARGDRTGGLITALPGFARAPVVRGSRYRHSSVLAGRAAWEERTMKKLVLPVPEAVSAT